MHFICISYVKMGQKILNLKQPKLNDNISPFPY